MAHDINDIVDERTQDVRSVGENYRDEFLSKRPKTEWSPYLDETAKDLSADIQIGDLELSKDDFGRELGEYYRRGLEQTAGRYADLPDVLEQAVSDEKLGLLAYQLNELSYDVTTTELGIDDVEQATEAVVEKLLTRHVGGDVRLSFELSGGTVADIATQLFDSDTVASNVDVLLQAFEDSASRGLLSLLDEPQMMTPLWGHQRDALAQWATNGSRGYVDMATATGKTVLGLAALALQYGELHPQDQDIEPAASDRNSAGSDDVLVVAHSDLILEQWRREFDRHLNIPQERTTGSDDITLEWGTVHFRTPQALVNEAHVDYDLVLLDEAHHYATGSEWGSLLDAFDGDVLAMSGSVDDAGADSERIKDRLANSIGPEVARYTITDAREDGVIPSFDWEVQYAPYDVVGDELEKTATRAERAFRTFQQQRDSGELTIDTDRRLRTYEDVRRFSHTTAGNELKQQNPEFRNLVTRLFSRRTKQWNLSPVLDAVVDLVVEHSTTENVVVLADSNAQVEELESRLRDVVADPDAVYRVSGAQSQSEQRGTIDAFDRPESAGVLLGTGDLLGEGVDMQHAAVAVNMATGGVNPELVQRIGRVLRNPADTPKHAMFYNVVGVLPTEAAAVPREDGKQLIEQAAGFCALGGRFDKLPGFSTAETVDTGLLGTILDEGASFVERLDADGVYDWETETVDREDLDALYEAVQAGNGDTDTILGEWEEYAWEHSSDEPLPAGDEDEEAVGDEEAIEKEDEDEPTDDTDEATEEADEDEPTDDTDEATEEADEDEPTAEPDEPTTEQDVSAETRDRVADIVRLQPTTNAELQSRWGYASEAALTDYLQSELRAYYFRDAESLVWATDDGEALLDDEPTEEASAEEESVDEASAEEESPDEAPAEEESLDEAPAEEESPDEEESTEESEERTALLEEIQRLHAEHGDVPSKPDMRWDGEYDVAAYEERFGTWSAAVEAAGFEPHGSQTREYSREDVVSGLRAVGEKIGTPPATADVDEHAAFSASVVYNFFDSLSDAREAAGVAEPPFGSEDRAGGEEATGGDEDTAGGDEATGGDAATEGGDDSSDVEPSPLAEYYELFRTLESVLSELVETDRATYAPDLPDPMTEWVADIENVVYGSGLDGGIHSYGQQQTDRNPVTMPTYRERFGDGERVTDYQCVQAAERSGEDVEVLAETGSVDPDETVSLPVTPDSETVLPVTVDSERELIEARELLEEFPVEPAVAEGASNEEEQSGSPDERESDDSTTSEPEEQESDDSTTSEPEEQESDDATRSQPEEEAVPDDPATEAERDPGDGVDESDGSATEQTVFWDTDVEPITEFGEEEGATETADSDAERGELDKKIDEWKSQLLDLTRRNNLVSFSPTKTKSLPFEQTDPTAVAAQLDGDGALYVRKRPAEDDEDGSGAVSSDELPETAPDELRPTRVADEAADSLSQIGLKNKQHLRERGVDSLYLSLGMLRWYSVDHSDEANRSPLFLAPVELEERTLQDPDRHDYVLTPKAEGLRLNPALRKKLAAERSIELPADSALSLERIDAAFESVAQTLSGFERWTVQQDVVLGIFDFTKFSLYADLERNREAVKLDPVIRALNGDTVPLQASEGGIESPRADELDDVVDPTDTYQVLDADSSQQEAIEAAKRGKSFVLQGPPGTGKSQTIANIVAEKLADGEKVLFVSEKQAALDVVKNRLDDVGIGRFCLEVHGEKATNADVLADLEDELKASQVKSPAQREQRLRALRERRDTINEYGDHLFYSPSGWELTAYQAFGIVSEHADAPRIETGIDDPLGVGEETLRSAVDELETLARYADELDHEETSPWRHTTLSRWGVDTADSMRQSLDRQLAVVEELTETAAELAAALGVQPDCLSAFRTVDELLEQLRGCPEIAWQRAFFEDSFVQGGSRLDELAELEQERSALMAALDEQYQRSVFSVDGAELNNQLAGYGLLKALKPSYRSLRRQVTTHTEDGYDPGHDELLEDTRKLAEIQRIEERRDDYQGVVQRLGPLYEGGDTDWATLRQARDWVAGLREFDDADTEPVVDAVLDGSLPDVDALQAETEAVLERYDDVAAFFEGAMAVEEMVVDGEPFREAPLSALAERLEALRGAVPQLQGRVQFEGQLARVRETVCANYVDRFLDGDDDADQLLPAFEKRFYTEWLDGVYEQTGLGSFNADEIERYLEEFRRLDQEQQELAKIAIQHEVTRQRPSLNLQHAASSEQVLVRRETEKQRRHKPLRELFDEAGEFITRLTPCFMMSPLSVAQYLKADSIQFDTVVFDEASQIMPQDAVSSLVRADQAIIAGDTKQLPPTSFFQSDVETTEDVREDLDSILEETASVLPEKRLRWHYRSRTEELIQFSNYHYYNDSLRTFPENDPDVETGVEFDYVSDGVYDRGGSRQNEVEATRVVDHIEEHAEEHGEKSLGVVAFSSAQEQAIRDAIAERREESPVLDAFVSQDDVLDEFFVKNLEMVQGDERDRMIFSVGYGPDREGTISMNFGPLNRSGGERRLNVAVTRAKERVTVVSSIQPGDVDLTRTNSTGVAHFKNYLEYAQTGERALARDDRVTSTLDFDSRFEEAVYDALVDRGYDVVSQVQSSSYSIDLAIKHPEQPGKFVLGIECDGAAYHSSKTARDRDRTRQMVLEELGWTIHRIWSPDWTSNRERELEAIVAKVDSLLDGGAVDDGDLEVPSYEPEVIEVGSKTEHDEITEYEAPALAWTERYSVDREGMDRASRNAAEDAVLKNGPIEYDRAIQAYLDVWSQSRAGSKVQRIFRSKVDELVADGRLVEHGEFLWPPREALTFQVRVNTDADSRPIDEIPTEEVAKALAVIVAEGGTMARDDLVLETTRLFGYQRRGSRIEANIEAALTLLEEEELVTDGEEVALDATVDPDTAILSRVYPSVSADRTDDESVVSESAPDEPANDGGPVNDGVLTTDAEPASTPRTNGHGPGESTQGEPEQSGASDGSGRLDDLAELVAAHRGRHDPSDHWIDLTFENDGETDACYQYLDGAHNLTRLTSAQQDAADDAVAAYGLSIVAEGKTHVTVTGDSNSSAAEASLCADLLRDVYGVDLADVERAAEHGDGYTAW